MWSKTLNTYRFYDYDRCYAHYTERILTLRQAKVRGEVIVAKPVLLLAVIDGIEHGEIRSNAISLGDWLERRYATLMRQYTRRSIFGKITPINNPFWHLQGDGFWHLQYADSCQAKPSSTPTTSWLKANTRFAYVDNDLWTLLQNAVMRQRLRNFIIDHKLTRPDYTTQTDDTSLSIAAESLPVLAALLLVA